MGLVCSLVGVFVLAIVARAILSWFPLSWDSPFAQVYRFLESVTEPVLGPARRAIPSFGGFDLSPIVVIIGLQLVAGAVFGC